ncbi:T9SS type A sorting domain-containing protein [Epilithonimonas vandammei]|uniref:T9SS C-terminal target domain-containing protein n=1 Tax=Epilithonimonas vandammei TaxID=2487072 RepID=A0A3G8Y024_9FLAO|nr:T9SS type A sorting domain-containing protein [Epilithonimonas vandammei]AZI38518.1 T9SS C-terminal target domain-containing protein [Epilithonimonas vandammei]
MKTKLLLLLTIQIFNLYLSQKSGELDQNFYADNGLNNSVQKIIIQPDKKVLVSGIFKFFNGVSKQNFLRLNSDGKIDINFLIGESLNSNSNDWCDMILQNDGKILLTTQGKFDSQNVKSLIRINNDGTIDTGFQFDANFYISRLAITNDNKIICVGGAEKLIRLSTNGLKDESFKLDPAVKLREHIDGGGIGHVFVQNDDKIIINYGPIYDTTYINTIITMYRLNKNGEIDNTFNAPDITSVKYFKNQSDGKIIVLGKNKINNSSLFRLNNDGSLDLTFNGYSYDFLNNHNFEIDSNDDIYILNNNRVIKLNKNGEIDSNFNTNASSANNPIFTITIDDQKIYLGGAFQQYSGVTKNFLARIYKNSESLSTQNIVSENILYPNPFNSNVYISEKILKIEIYDFNGRLIKNIDKIEKNSDFSYLKKGEYIFVLFDGKTKKSVKMIKK